MDANVNAPDGVPTEDPTTNTPAPEGNGNEGGEDYYKAEIRKISLQRDEAKAKLRDQEEGHAEALRGVTEQLDASKAQVSSLQAEMRTGEITRELLKGVPAANHAAVLTLYTAGAAELDKPELKPTEVAAAALVKLKGTADKAGIAAALWIDPTATPAPATEPAPAPEPDPITPPAKLSGQPAKEDPKEYLRPDVRRAKQAADFRKKYPGTTGFSL